MNQSKLCHQEKEGTQRKRKMPEQFTNYSEVEVLEVVTKAAGSRIIS